MRILFVCTGNTCRSPMAEAILRNKIKNAEVSVSSCGISSNGGGASKNAIIAMSELGIDIGGHLSKKCDENSICRADYVFTMSRYQKAVLLSYFPNANIYTLGELVNIHMDIMDPYGGDLFEYRHCRDEILKIIDKLISKNIIEESK